MANKITINADNLDFDLPDDLIAQEPLENRDEARLLVMDKRTGELSHRHFHDLVSLFHSGDVLVLNRAQVNPARVFAQKETGGRVEIVFLGPQEKSELWEVLVKPPLKEGIALIFSNGQKGILAGRDDSGSYLLNIGPGVAEELMRQEGRVPLPPYIKRQKDDVRHEKDQSSYQTVYAATPGSVAAPTAGLHFSNELLENLKNKGIETVELVLHVGWGTFRPIRSDVDSHQMLPERYEVSAHACQRLLSARLEGRRLIAVGTTSTRTLESLDEAQCRRGIEEGGLSEDTSLFIKPGFEFQWLNGLITNFHVPRSTPIALTAAFGGLPYLERAYEKAIEERYRFFSYGDAMLII